MKKNLLALSLILFLGMSLSYAKDAIFDSHSNNAENVQKVSLTPVKNQTTASPQITPNTTQKEVGQIQKESFEAAIQNLDSAQVEVRDELAQYTQIYNEALTRYNTSKEECRALRAQIRTIKNKIRTIERTKKSINKQIIKYYEN